MARRSSNLVWPLVLGSSAGVIAALLVWKYASSQLDKSFAQGGTALTATLTAGGRDLQTQFLAARTQAEVLIRTTVAQEVAVQVDQQIRQQLDSYGLTRARMQWLTQQISRLQASGVLG